ncbi:putative DNA-binding transcriptional regulator AlpA [Bradyrhizobium sp. LB1.3]
MDDRDHPCWPRGLSRVRAAAYVGVSHAIWDRMVAAGEMPKPKRTYGRTIWDKRAVDKAFDALDSGNSTPFGDEVIDFAP